MAANADNYQVFIRGQAVAVSGTSAATPLWAGLIGQINQGIGGRAGLLQPMLYGPLLTAGALNDITTGDNGAYTAGVGWDACTGLGAPNGTAILLGYRAARQVAPAVTQLSESSGNPGDQLVVTGTGFLGATAVGFGTVAAGFGQASASSVATVAGLHDVAAAAGGLTLTNRTISGTVPAINVNGGGFGGGSGNGSAGSGGAQSFRANFTTSSFGVAGVDIGHGELGPLSSGQLGAGRTFTASDANADVALVDASYATQNKLTTGSTIAVGNKSGKPTNFKVVGIVTEPAGDNPSDVYIPLAVAQNLVGMKNQVNTIYVTASNSSAISSVQSEISKVLPGYTVTTSSDLASEVTGSLSSASSLANNLGKWLAIAVLVASFLLASLLTIAAVSRRVREFGTLKAIGWRSRRIIGQVMGETVTLGLIGGAIGVGLGLIGAELVSKLSPKLSAVVGQTTGSATPGGARQFGVGGAGGGGFPGGGGGGSGGGPGAGAFRPAAASHTVVVHLSAATSANVILLAVALAVLGGIIAGMFGGWRAARLRPADALSKVA